MVIIIKVRVQVKSLFVELFEGKGFGRVELGSYFVDNSVYAARGETVLEADSVDSV